MNIFAGKITDPYILFMLYPGDKNTDEYASAASDALLHIIATENADKRNKMETLQGIMGACVQVNPMPSDEEMGKSFKLLCDTARLRSEIITPAEFKWINEFIVSCKIRRHLSEMLYSHMLRFSGRSDTIRQAFAWTDILSTKRTQLAKAILEEVTVTVKRRRIIAKEFGFNSSRLDWYYFRTLLLDGHYKKAVDSGLNDFNLISDLVIEVIATLINGRLIPRALELSRRFLPDRQDIIEELMEIPKECWVGKK